MARRRVAPRDVMAEHVASLPDEWLQCQITQRHTLPLVVDPTKTRFKKQRTGGFRQVADCIFCGTEVTIYVAASGDLSDTYGRGYVHPKGFLKPKEAKGIDRKEAQAMRRREGRLRNEQRRRELAQLAANRQARA